MMERHIKTIGVVYLVLGSLVLLAFLALCFAIAPLVHPFIGELTGDPVAAGWVSHVRWALLVLAALISAPAIAGGIGLLQRREWGRITVLVLGFISLVAFPIGTMLGAYTIWVLVQRESKEWCRASGQVGLPAGSAAPLGASTPPRDYRLTGLVWITVGVTAAICAAFSVGLWKGAGQAMAVGIWGVIPVAVGVAMFLYGMLASREKTGSGGGGESGTLGAFLILTGLMVPLLATGALAYTHEETFEKTVSASGMSQLNVWNRNGAVRVEPWDQPEIRVSARKKVVRSTLKQAQAYAARIEIRVEPKGDQLEIRTLWPDLKDSGDWVEGVFSFDWLFEPGGKETTVSITISAPRKIDAELRSTNGNIGIGAMEGQASLTTTNGGLTAEGFHGQFKGRSTNGSIRLTALEGGCDAATTNGAIQADFAALGAAGCKLRSTNGAIRMVLPEDTKADLDASTSNGRISCDLPLSLAAEATRRRTRGKINGGGPPVELRTTNGSISVQKGVGAAPKGVRAPAVPDTSRSDLAGKAGAAKPTHVRIQFWEDGQQKVKLSVPISLAQETLESLPEEARDVMRERGINVERLIRGLLSSPKPGKLVEVQDENSQLEIELVME